MKIRSRSWSASTSIQADGVEGVNRRIFEVQSLIGIASHLLHCLYILEDSWWTKQLLQRQVWHLQDHLGNGGGVAFTVEPRSNLGFHLVQHQPTVSVQALHDRKIGKMQLTVLCGVNFLGRLAM